MKIPGVTWQGESIDDVEILPELPPGLVSILADMNGFILYEGALHVRGASLTPEWHSLRAAWRGPKSFCSLYPDVRASDVSFAQDQVGDQFLIRDVPLSDYSRKRGKLSPCLTVSMISS